MKQFTELSLPFHPLVVHFHLTTYKIARIQRPVQNRLVQPLQFGNGEPGGQQVGGRLGVMTAKEQLLYEVTDPARYVTPDVAGGFHGGSFARNRFRPSTHYRRTRADLSRHVESKRLLRRGLRRRGRDFLRRPECARAKLAGAIIDERLKDRFPDLRIDYISYTSVHRTAFGTYPEPYEVRLRVAGQGATPAQAVWVGEEVEALYTNGPAGSGGARKYVHEVVDIVSTLIDRQRVTPKLTILTV